MTRKDLEQIAGEKLNDAQLIASYLDYNLAIRHSVAEVAELVAQCLLALNIKRQEPL